MITDLLRGPRGMVAFATRAFVLVAALFALFLFVGLALGGIGLLIAFVLAARIVARRDSRRYCDVPGVPLPREARQRWRPFRNAANAGAAFLGGRGIEPFGKGSA